MLFQQESKGLRSGKFPESPLVPACRPHAAISTPRHPDWTIPLPYTLALPAGRQPTESP